MSSSPLDLEATRHAAQLAFIASGAPLTVGSLDHSPWPLRELQALRPGDPGVELSVESGYTATVLRLRSGDGAWTLKRARPRALVDNVDGRTSFLNEIQRRADFDRLKRQPGGDERWQGIVDTCFASFRDGVLLSPWIEGRPVDDWDERRLVQVLELACDLWLEGLFEWDLCRGNILDDGRRLRLFDFGYLYRFDPRRQFSSAGRGDDMPLFHPAERFESRCFSAALLDLEQREGHVAALAAFRLEKEIALQAYRRMRSAIAARGAQARVLDWLDAIAARWAAALKKGLDGLYLAECWRSHVLDLHDDLRGRTCTPMTLRRVDWLLAALDGEGAALVANDALFWGDELHSPAVLRERYLQYRRTAAQWMTGVSTQ